MSKNWLRLWALVYLAPATTFAYVTQLTTDTLSLSSSSHSSVVPIQNLNPITKAALFAFGAKGISLDLATAPVTVKMGEKGATTGLTNRISFPNGSFAFSFTDLGLYASGNYFSWSTSMTWSGLETGENGGVISAGGFGNNSCLVTTVAALSAYPNWGSSSSGDNGLSGGDYFTLCMLPATANDDQDTYKRLPDFNASNGTKVLFYYDGSSDVTWSTGPFDGV